MFKSNKGVSLISVLVIVIIVLIIASISIMNGTRHVEEANDSKKQQALSTVQAMVNSISLKQATAGVFSPAEGEVYGTPVEEAKDVYDNLAADYAEGWYILDKDDLEKIGVSYISDSFIVNYKTGEVKYLSEFVQNSPTN